MQTSHVDNTNTHAVIGGGQAVAFHTAQTAEFFEILSSTLYSDKPLAFAREVICNAWDSHVVSGKTKVPVEVTVDTTNITIRDFGLGIPDDKMAEIYCVYGNSTKENDGLQTGGFGLGSKAPFAYTKNFAVTSFNNGVKSLYNISRGSTATAGVPDMRKIVSVPTTEQGLLVSVPTGAERDVSIFINLFKGLCRAGGILVRINGSLQKPMFYPENLPFMLTNKSELPGHLSTKDHEYYVKYGSVLYPVDMEKISPRAKIRVTGLRGNEGFQLPVHSSQVIIFMAPAHSIGVTPSRESLSYTPKTIDTLTKLLEQSNKLFKEVLPMIQKGMVSQYSNIFAGAERGSLDDYLKGYEKSQQGYDMFVQYAKQQAIQNSHTLGRNYTMPCMTKDDLVNFAVMESLNKGTMTHLVSDHYLAADPKGIELRKIIVKIVRMKFPREAVYAFKMLKHKLSINTIGKMENVTMAKDVIREMKPLHLMNNVTVRFKHRRYISEDNHISDIEKYASPQNYRYHATTLIDMIKEQLSKGPYLPVVIAPSFASKDRALKRDNSFLKNVDAWVEIVVNDKFRFESVLRRLAFHKKRKILDTRESGKIAPRPVIESPTLYALVHDDMGGRVVKKITNENPTHFMPTPGRFMVPDRNSTHEITAKCNLSFEELDMICYLFPNVVLSSTTEESTYLESIGMTNIFKTIAEEAKEFFEDTNNVQAIMENMSAFSKHFRNYTLSRLLSLMSPAQVLEGLGREPKIYGTAKPMSSICHLFASIANGDHLPRFGMQYCHRVAKDLAAIFGKLFEMDMELFTDPDLAAFLGSLPDSNDATFKKHKSIYQTVAISAMQHARVQMALGKKRYRR